MDQVTIFVCSTYADLSEERAAVLDAIRRLQLQHDSMEFFGARENRPLETCLAEVRRSNLVLVIVGHRYGMVAPELGISFSEAEYREGRRLGKPSLVYMRDESVPVLPRNIERDPTKLSLLETWKSVLQERHTVATFRQSSDLALQVAADLGRTISELRSANQIWADAPPATAGLLEIQTLIQDAKANGVGDRALLSAVRRAIAGLVSGVREQGPSVFLSYTRADADPVRRVAEGLRSAGMQVWFDESSLSPGDNWLIETERALDSADFVIAFISRNIRDNGWAHRELQVALQRRVSGQRGALILPVLLDDADGPPLLRDIHSVSMTDGDVDAAVRALVKAIDQHTIANDEVVPTLEQHESRGLSEQKVSTMLEEEGGVISATATRLGIPRSRLYRLLRHYNIDHRTFK